VSSMRAGTERTWQRGGRRHRAAGRPRTIDSECVAPPRDDGVTNYRGRWGTILPWGLLAVLRG
jgi:hypothetical protein